MGWTSCFEKWIHLQLKPPEKDTISQPNSLVFEDKLDSYVSVSDTLILVEGYPDSFTLYQQGFHVVGLLGLEALSKQASKFSKFSKVICVFDNDKF